MRKNVFGNVERSVTPGLQSGRSPRRGASAAFPSLWRWRSLTSDGQSPRRRAQFVL